MASPPCRTYAETKKRSLPCDISLQLTIRFLVLWLVPSGAHIEIVERAAAVPRVGVPPYSPSCTGIHS